MEPEEPFRHMAPSAPPTAPLVFSVDRMRELEIHQFYDRVQVPSSTLKCTYGRSGLHVQIKRE